MPEVQERMVGQAKNESDQHYNAKRELCDFLNRYGIEAFMEHPVPALFVDRHCRADVAIPALKIAFEIERGEGNQRYGRHRAKRLEEQGWQVVILHMPVLPACKSRKWDEPRA